uniref:Secreted protein n=1 Tax=Haemonchus contortus TaxID=6289 RepID=A0A7I4YGH9_HAECO
SSTWATVHIEKACIAWLIRATKMLRHIVLLAFLLLAWSVISEAAPQYGYRPRPPYGGIGRPRPRVVHHHHHVRPPVHRPLRPSGFGYGRRTYGRPF